MSRIYLISPVVLLVASPALAEGPKRTPTAMHTIKTDAPKKDDVKKDEPKKDDVKKNDATPKKVDVKKDEPKKDEPKKNEPKVSKDPPKPKPPCLHDPIAMTRGIEEEHFVLTQCDGTPTVDGVTMISILARPDPAPKPSAPLATLAKGPDVAPGIKRVDANLAVRLQAFVDHFKQPNKMPRMHVISGYRPSSLGSFHATARALDLWMDNVSNEQLVAFCKTLPDTGCGYYPNSSFIHLDVRDPGTGHVSWIDASGPGESPRYVSVWPPPMISTPTDVTIKLEKILPSIETDDHPAEIPEPPEPPATIATDILRL